MQNGSLWGSHWTLAGVWIGALSLIGLLARQVVPWRRLSADVDKALRSDLLARVQRLERTLDRERTHRDAERALDRHRLNNVTQCFDALLMLIEAAPEKATEAVSMIKGMRARQQQDEAKEKAIIRAAEIAAAEAEAQAELQSAREAAGAA